MNKKANDDPLLKMKLPRINEKVNEGIIGIDEFIIDAELQVRERMREDIVSRYMNVLAVAPDTMPPIKLARIPVQGGTGSLLHLIDGFHRCEAARRLERESVKAEVVDVDSLQEAKFLAGVSNLRNGLPLRSAEVREVFRAFIKAKMNVVRVKVGGRNVYQLMTYTEIAAALCNVKSRTTIFNWMHEDFPNVAAKMAAKEMSGSDKTNRKGIAVEMSTLIEQIDELKLKMIAAADDPDIGEVYRHLDRCYEEVNKRAKRKEKDGFIDAFDADF